MKHDDSISNTRYIHGFQYYDNVLQFFHTPEGYVKNTPTDSGTPSFDYVYQYKDHLGNVRVNYTQNPQTGTVEILNESHYYPFGLQHNNYNSDLVRIKREEGQNNEKILDDEVQPLFPIANRGYQYKFGGKELQSEFGVEMYDFGARNYDPALGRWMNIDPLAEKYVNMSPYSYAVNNPVYFIDPDGMQIEPGSQKEWDKQKQQVNTQHAIIGVIFALTGSQGEQFASLSETIDVLNTLEESSQVYSLEKVGENELGGITYDSNTGNIVIAFGSTGNFVHETSHGGQFEKGELAFDSNTGDSLGQDIYDEVSAYKAQFGYDPSSVSGLESTSGKTVNSFSDITPSWVQGLDGGTLYNPGGRANTGVSQLNINSTKADFIKAYPHNASAIQQSLPSNFVLKNSYPSIHYKK